MRVCPRRSLSGDAARMQEHLGSIGPGHSPSLQKRVALPGKDSCGLEPSLYLFVWSLAPSSHISASYSLEWLCTVHSLCHRDRMSLAADRSLFCLTKDEPWTTALLVWRSSRWSASFSSSFLTSLGVATQLDGFVQPIMIKCHNNQENELISEPEKLI